MGIINDELEERMSITSGNNHDLNIVNNNNNNNSSDLNCDISGPDRMQQSDGCRKPPIEYDYDSSKSLDLPPRWRCNMRKFLIFMTMCSTLMVGLLINAIQLLLVILFKLSNNPKWRFMIKKINGKLLYVILSQPIWLISHASNFELDVQLDDVSLIDETEKPMMAVVIVNHSFELDYMICLAIGNQLGNVGCYKTVSKDELKYIPIIGWALWMSDILFVKRNWQDDRPRISRKLNDLLYYEQMVIGLFAEGTRWTKEKHQLSVEFANSRGLTPLRHHLIPRARGFNYIMRHYLRDIATGGQLSGRPFKLLNMQFVMPDHPSFSDFFEGKKIKAHIYVEEVDISEEIKREAMESVDEDHCPKLSAMLQEIYLKKEKIVDDFYANGKKFKLDGCRKPGPFQVKEKLFPKLSWSISFILCWSLIIYLAINYFADSVLFWTILVAYFGLGFLMIKKIERESKTKSVAETKFSGRNFRFQAQGQAKGIVKS